MIGLHPTSVKENFRQELSLLEKELSNFKNRVVAIGEVGVDLYWSREFEELQYEAFGIQLDWAAKYDLPVIIHTRNSFDEAIGIIDQKIRPGIKGIFHCFSGTIEQAKRAISSGFLLGIGGVVTYKNSTLASVVEKIGLEHLVLETDAPFLPPVPYRGKRNESAYIPLIAARIAEIKKTSLEEVALISTLNASKLFGV